MQTKTEAQKIKMAYAAQQHDIAISMIEEEKYDDRILILLREN